MDQEQLETKLTAASPAAEALGNAMNADILFFSGDIRTESSLAFIKKCRALTKKRANVLLVAVSYGGSPTAAYRMARHLQRNYTEISIFIPGTCSSAGTLLATGAHKIYMGELGELGPLDIQISKKDEIWASASGLNVDAAISALEEIAEKMFFRYVYEIKSRSFSVTYKTAAEISVDLVGKLLAPVYDQIAPSEIGENSRAMDITKNYAKRLDDKTKNFKTKESMEFLVESYPSHDFIIDQQEAREIYTNVLDPTEHMLALENALGDLAILPLDWQDGGAFEVRFLSCLKPDPANEPSVHLSIVDKDSTGART